MSIGKVILNIKHFRVINLYISSWMDLHRGLRERLQEGDTSGHIGGTFISSELKTSLFSYLRGKF
jgi:hypothetical protein